MRILIYPVSIFLSAFSDWRLRTFKIGTTYVNPRDTAPTADSISVCHSSQNDALRKAEARSFNCVVKGRYVVILQGEVQFLTLCEVEVYGMYYSTSANVLISQFH